MRRAAVALCAALLAACGGGEPAPEPAPIVTERVGRGAQTAWVIRPRVDRPQPVVIFLHGWGATLPGTYEPWLQHLARQGNAVIYPRYQDSFLTPPAQVLANALAGIRLALRSIEARPGGLVVAGHSAGGALAADYAAVARKARLPVPAAILSLYPGRTLDRLQVGIPEIAAPIPSGTRVVAMAGARDGVVGRAPARRIARRGRGSFVLVRERGVADHLGPQRSTPAARRVFWRRLDALIARAR